MVTKDRKDKFVTNGYYRLQKVTVSNPRLIFLNLH